MAIAMGIGCSSSRLAPEEQLDVPAKATTGRRGGFAGDLFGRGERRKHRSSNVVADDKHGTDEQQQQQDDEKKVVRGEQLARSPGSPSFRHYCGDVVAAAVAATERREER